MDPGLRTTGFGVVEVRGAQLIYIASGTIRTSQLPTGDLPGRIRVLFEGVCGVVQRYEPQVAALEVVFVNSNPQSSLLLGQARGACLSALAAQPLAVFEYTALQVKKTVVGYGKAQKVQVQEMVKRLLQLPALPGPDAGDALGLAITHAHAGRALALLEQAAPRAVVGSRLKSGRLS
jgi:crossover junction endodeoxyribonuclease RuvC